MIPVFPIFAVSPSLSAQPPAPLLLARFMPLDWAVLAAYFVILVITGWWFSRRKQTGTEDYFLGGRRMPVWAVAISILATTQSAATFIGGPQESYAGDMAYLATNVGMIIAAFVVAFVFIPVYYRLGVSTPYGMLATRFGHGAVQATSIAYLIGRVFASGARVFIAAIPVAIILFGAKEKTAIPPSELMIGITVLTAVGIVYTLVGGIRSVIWTDVIQCAIYLGATVVAIVVLLDLIPASLGDIITALRTGGEGGASKLTLLHSGVHVSERGLTFDISHPYTMLSILIGFTLMGVASYGTDQDMVQRMLTCQNARKGAQSAIWGIVVGVPAVLLFLVVGLLLWVFYRRPDLMGDAYPEYEIYDSAQVFLSFILAEMPPGISGLMLAGLFAAGLSSVNSTLNAMSSTFVNEIYRRQRPARDEAHYLKVGRIGVVVWGVILGVFAALCIYWQRANGEGLIKFALAVMAFAWAGLLGVFLTALFTKRGNTASVIVALVSGFLAVLAMQPTIWSRWTAWLPGVTADPELWDITDLRITFTLQLTIAAGLAFALCCLGSPVSTEPAPEERT